ncbi:16S rRNA (guanine(966)-N(2))-methyltransferase RsmD [Georgenia sunbinii]|uniref:16S rRNA (guanine(966)-N(2))-methyltransferase RsmD n=1 Tax=Georgenia sunbinii TaxID=3117728 RepID=UPI002F266FBA
MTRIVAGTAGGRTLVVPKGATRPTSERVREALFSRLEHLDVVDDARVLDLYAGSGALGLEAASRGAAAVTLVDSGRQAAEACRRNAATLGFAQVTTAAATAHGFLTTQPATPHHLVLVDPPYDVAESALAEVLAALDTGWLADGAVVVVERDRRSPEPTWPAGLEPAKERRYGDTTLWFASTP